MTTAEKVIKTKVGLLAGFSLYDNRCASFAVEPASV